MPARTRDAVMEGTYGPAPFEVVKLRIRALQQHIDQALVLIDESTDEHEQEEDDLVGSLRRRLFRHGANGSLDRLKLLRHDIMVSKGISSDRLEHNIISAKIDIFRDWMSQVTRRLIQLDRSSSRSVSYLLQAFDLLFQDGIALPTHLDVHHNHPPRFLSRLQRLIDRGVVELDVKEKTVTEIVYRLLDSIHAPLNLEWPVKTALFDKMIRYNTGDPSVILLTGWCVALALGPPHAIDDTTALSSDLAKCLSNHALAHDLRSCAHRHDVEDAFARHCGRILLGRIESSSSSSSTTSMALSPGHNRLRPIEGLRNDFMSRWRVYRSDWLDGFQIKSFLIIVHMYLISVAPVLALGTLVQHETAAAFEVRDFIMASGIAGIAFHLFAGQPLVIVSSTGPVAMFISMFHKMCSDMHVPFADAYALVGLWAMLFLLVLAAASASILLRQVTRFTDDIFHGIVAVLFISEPCRLLYLSMRNDRRDKALFVMILIIGTAMLTLRLRNLRQSQYFIKSLRTTLSDLGPCIALVTMSALAYAFRDIDQSTVAASQLAAISLSLPHLSSAMVIGTLPIGFMLTLLIYLEHGLTARIVNAPEHCLQKPPAPHLDYAVIGIAIAFCSLTGLPWMVGTPIQSMRHCQLLSKFQKRDAASLNQRTLVGVTETRVTGLGMDLLMLLTMATPVSLFRLIPSGAISGLLLYMGLSSLTDNHLALRIRLLFTDPVFWVPAEADIETSISSPLSVRHIEIHLFTIIQLLCLVVLVGIEQTPFGITFPLLAALLLPFRLRFLSKMFTQRALEILDPISRTPGPKVPATLDDPQIITSNRRPSLSSMLGTS